ncbi:glycan metabolism protein RagB [Bacteroidia bacterium]|nr:glycan metabolism protein RagB [Bacteroidia bacterium]
MKKTVFILLITTGLALFSSCSDFLHEYPKDLTYATSSDDLKELLIGNAYIGSDLYIFLPKLSDDLVFVRSSTATRGNLDAYWWDPMPNTEVYWKDFYRRISITNVVIYDIEEFKDEPGDGYRRVKGEAHFLRAAFYYYLVNFYGKPYSAKTANTDLGVPLKLSPAVEDKRYVRNTVQECYDQIINDLNIAIECLSGISSGVYRTGESAPHFLLSRIYLYMGRWEEVLKQTEILLANQSYSLLDYNKVGPVASADVVWAGSPEVVFTNGQCAYGEMEYYPTTFYSRANDEIIGMYESNDLRRAYFFRGDAIFSPRKKRSSGRNTVSDYFIFRLPEIYLNQAEALVMLDRDAEAIAAVQKLRETRYVTGTLPALNLSGESLANFIRDDRRREFAFEGQRYFDLRRYAVSPKWPFQKEIRHPYYPVGGTEVIGDRVLGKYDDEPEFYVFPIPESEIVNNAGSLIQNETRAQKLPL